MLLTAFITESVALGSDWLKTHTNCFHLLQITSLVKLGNLGIPIKIKLLIGYEHTLKKTIKSNLLHQIQLIK